MDIVNNSNKHGMCVHGQCCVDIHSENTFSKVLSLHHKSIMHRNKQTNKKIKKQIVYIIFKNNYNNVVIKITMWKAKS